ncbi:hypothetical protein SODALDRAFT_375558 [Sodiomyces alkalinus F11]|uniref:Box C/D snoRNA protein 1 n=1 Tax=Sodiomyces alkalinus (strain CBS 110278 / VKM F-3762 / F11) TaxID=1314773 RepID=A0A3N2Q9J6_SODAK|nr:hypothetical protein SODALDRAFT_375558 [Sodiomyces alkalinus F11]ROT43377.1 hypothetical protein SODALDRAFT_375558 [Sodiomyces alkalinus F11]
MPPSSASADPLLTSLCAICHIQPPKYKCPACALRTCSLACSRKHKAWSSCSGVRDPTAYIPPSKLKTPAGIDHDYNFLSAIERARQRSEREIVEERHLLTENQLRSVDAQTVKWRRGKDGVKRKVLVARPQRGSGPAGGRPELSKQMQKRLATFGIDVRRVPLGMTRQKENGTHVHKASGRINWQVEWLLFESAADTAHDVQEPKWNKTRIMNKVMDDCPLYVAFAQAQAVQMNRLRKESQQTRDMTGASSNHPPSSRTRHKPPSGNPVDVSQDPVTGSWSAGYHSFQPYPDTAWKSRSGNAPFTGVKVVETAEVSKFKFYLPSGLPPATQHNKTVAHPVDPTVTLAEALRDTTVVEFPTLYVLPSSQTLPPTYFACPKSSRRNQAGNETNQRGRNDGVLQANRKRSHHALEEGEVASDDDDEETGPSGSLSSEEDADILVEEILGEEDDDDEEEEEGDNDDTTSSSGSDISSDESETSAAT